MEQLLQEVKHTLRRLDNIPLSAQEIAALSKSNIDSETVLEVIKYKPGDFLSTQTTTRVRVFCLA